VVVERSNAVAKKTGESQRRDWEVDFAHIELSSADKSELAKFDVKFEQTFDTLSRANVDGWKLSISRDERNDCTISALTSPKVAGGGRQVCITARGPDLMQAMRVLAYKIVVILEGDLTAAQGVQESRSQWG